MIFFSNPDILIFIRSNDEEEKAAALEIVQRAARIQLPEYMDEALRLAYLGRFLELPNSYRSLVFAPEDRQEEKTGGGFLGAVGSLFKKRSPGRRKLFHHSQ